MNIKDNRAILPKPKSINKHNMTEDDIDFINSINVTVCILHEQLEELKNRGIKFTRLNSKVKNMLTETQKYVDDFTNNVAYKQAPTEVEVYVQQRLDLCKIIASTTCQDNFPFIKYMNNYKPQQDKYTKKVREQISDKKIIKELQDELAKYRS